MALCVIQQLVYVAASSNGQATLAISALVPLEPQPADLSICANVLVSGAQAVQLAVVTAPFDPVLAASYWSFALTFAVSVYLISKNAGMILSAVRRW